MTDDTRECPVCGGDGFQECDDGSEMQCERCGGIGQVPIERDEPAMA